MIKETILTIFIIFLLILIIILMTALCLNQMGEQFDKDCSEQNYEGEIDYRILTIDCADWKVGKSIRTINSSEQND